MTSEDAQQGPQGATGTEPRQADPSAQAGLGAPDRDATFASWLLGAALVFGLLRFVRLGEWSLWLDEVYAWGDSHAVQAVDAKVGYLLIRWTVEALGGTPSETALRLTPALIGYAAIPLTYWAFWPVAGRARAATAALVVALSAWEIQWSQTARFYTMVQALGLLGGGLSIRGLISGRWLLTVLGILLAGLGVLFHLEGAVVAGAIGAAAFLVPPVTAPAARRSARLAFLACAIPSMLALPFVWSVFTKYLEKKAAQSPVASVAHFALTVGSFVTPTVAALALGSFIVAWRGKDRGAVFVGSVAVIGGATLAGVAAFATMSAQYAFAFFPWIALLAAWPIGRSGGSRVGASPAGNRSAEESPAGPRALWLLVLAVPLLSQSVLYFTVDRGQRARWREAVELVAARRSPEDIVIGAPAPVVEFYLTGGREADVRHHDAVISLDRYNPDPFESLENDSRVAWFVIRNDYNLSLARRDRERLQRFLTERCQFVEHFPVLVEARDLSISVWRFDPNE
ncbi:MAG: hypothetical protein ACJA0P_003618 [Planctomycetota bacterium]|jgi:hypothetical protein